MNPYLRVVLCGFGDFEQHTLGSVLRQGGSRAGHFVQVAEIADADLIVANADAPIVVVAIAIAEREADTVFIGTKPPERSLTCLRRPIDTTQVLNELDGLREQHLARRAPATPESRAPLDAAPPAPEPEPQVAATPDSTADASTAAEAMPAAPGVMALVVDDSPVAARFLQVRLRQMGVAAEVAGNSQHALELLAQKPFAWVFLDVELGEASGLDGLALCQHIKRWHLHPDSTPPTVVMVSAHQSPLDRVRGTFAGCDHYLAKPVDDTVLRRLVLPASLKTKSRSRRHWAALPQSAAPTGS
jgi:CheY-like chemotaxis protein